jgi:hypothetical protein
MPRANKNPRKKAFQDMLSVEGRRLDWLVKQLNISRQHFDRKLKDNKFTDKDWVKITHLVVNGTKSHYCIHPEYTPRPRHNRFAKQQ